MAKQRKPNKLKTPTVFPCRLDKVPIGSVATVRVRVTGRNGTMVLVRDGAEAGPFSLNPWIEVSAIETPTYKNAEHDEVDDPVAGHVNSGPLFEEK